MKAIIYNYSQDDQICEELTTDSGGCEYKVKWVGYTNRHNSWVAEEDLHANCLLEMLEWGNCYM